MKFDDGNSSSPGTPGKGWGGGSCGTATLGCIPPQAEMHFDLRSNTTRLSSSKSAEGGCARTTNPHRALSRSTGRGEEGRYSILIGGFAIVALASLLGCATGCQEPNYRTEVVGNGQGGVEIHHVAKDPAELAQDEARSHPAATAPADASRLDALEKRVREQDDEIARLKRQLNAPTTSPATAP